jgi:hypothetical protein
MEQARKEMIEKFFRKASIAVMIDKSPAAEILLKNGEFIIDIKNPLLVMGLGLDLNLLKQSKKKSVFRKALKDLGFKIKIRYKFFELEL